MNPLTYAPSSTPDAVLAGAAAGIDAPAAPAALDALLRLVVGGYFVLTDGQGSVSKWSDPAELLFGRAAEEILGQSFFETLIGGAMPPAGQAWRAFLDAGEPPLVAGTVQLSGRHTDGSEFPLEAVFVPVKLDEGFDFSLFLEDLSFELPMNPMLLRMRQQHPVVVRALRQAVEPGEQPWDVWRTAGTLVVFRPLSSTPWVEAELARREAERALADADTEDRLTNLDPGIQGGFADLDDAAAVVARLLSALARIDDLERGADAAREQLAAVVSGQHAASGVVSDELDRLRAQVDEHEAASLAQGAKEAGRAVGEELQAQVARLGGELDVARGQADRAETESLGARQAAAAAGEAAGAAREDAARAREEGARTRREVAEDRELTALLGADVVRMGGQVADVRAAEERAATLRTELGQVRDFAETAGRGIDALRVELAGVRELAEAVRADAAAARVAADYGDEQIVAMQAELTYALENLDELKQGLSSAGQAAVIARREAEQARKAAQHAGDGSTERVTEVFQQILGLAAARNASQSARRDVSVLKPPRAEPVKRAPRHGFDDAAVPTAILGLDGKFKELNPAFAKLVGYQEREFTKAAWPSPHDRRDYKDQLEQLRRMGAGELRGVELRSTYMHGQGLMVPVVGKLTVADGQDGLPLHLVLEAEVHHSVE